MNLVIPSLPSGSTADFVAGWNAAVAAIETLNGPPLVPPPPNAISVGPTDDICAVIAAAPAGALVTLSENVVYVITKPVIVTVANLTVNLNGSTLKMSAATQNSSNWSIQAAGFTCFNGVLGTGMGVCFHSHAPHTTLYDLTAADDAIDWLLLADAGATDATVHDVTIGYTDQETVYICADRANISGTFAGSRGQPCIRVSPDPTGHMPANCSFNVSVDQRGNKQNNEGLTIRRGTGAKIEGSTFQTYVRIGETGEPTAKAGDYGDATFDSCNFPNPPMIGFPHILLHAGCNLKATANRFTVDATKIPIAVPMSQANATLTANTMVRTVAGITTAGKLYSPKPNPAVAESGTTTIDP